MGGVANTAAVLLSSKFIMSVRGAGWETTLNKI